MKMLLGSGGFTTEERSLKWQKAIDAFLKSTQEILFIPYAQEDHDEYCARIIQKGFNAGRKLTGLHTFKDPKSAIENSQSLYIGGGNTFRLLNDLYRFDLLEAVRSKVKQGLPLLSASAGSNVCAPTIKTTNDMPIIFPPRFEALNLVPFQINPHYFEGPTYYKNGGVLTPYAGETRDERIAEFHELNDTPVVGITEGAWLHIENSTISLGGHEAFAKIFIKGNPPLRVTKESEHQLAVLIR